MRLSYPVECPHGFETCDGCEHFIRSLGASILCGKEDETLPRIFDIHWDVKTQIELRVEYSDMSDAEKARVKQELRNNNIRMEL